MTLLNKKNKAKDISEKSYFHLEASKSGLGFSLIVCGVITVSDFSDNQTILLTHGGRLNICGKDLKISIFENKSVGIKGKVASISFE